MAFQSIEAIRGRCWVKCGVLQETRGSKSLHGFVSTVWEDLRYAKSLTSVDIQFEKIDRKEKLVMEDLIKTYMEIGTANISVLMGPYTQVAATATHKFGIPYFIINDPGEVFFKPYNLISVLPQSRDKTDIAVQLVKSHNWTSVAVIYDGSDGVELIESLVRLPSIRVRAWRIESVTLASVDDEEGLSPMPSSSSPSPSSTVSPGLSTSVDEETLREILLKVRHLGMTNIIVVSSESITHSVIEMGLRLSMLSKRYSWLIPTLAPNEQLLKRYADTQVNLTTLRLVQSHLPDNEFTTSHYSKREYAAVYDSLLALYHGIKLQHRNNRSCIWTGKDGIDAVLTKIEDVGATGTLNFRSDGTRRGYTVNILSLMPEGLVQIGLWNSSVTDVSNRLFINTTVLDAYHHSSKSLSLQPRRQTFRIAALQKFPWLMVRDGIDQRSDLTTGSFEGFSIDLLNALSRKLGFSYSLYPVSEGPRIERLPNGSWTGLVGEIISQRATLAVGPLTITSAREEIIDFTKSFDTVSLTLVMRKSQSAIDGSSDSIACVLLFLFRPLSWVVWTLLLGVFLTTGLFLYVVDRFIEVRSTPDAQGPGHANTLLDSFWCVFSSMVLHTPFSPPPPGSSPSPRSSVGGRLLIGAIWWFSLITVTSYAANLAAMITLSRLETEDIHDLGDLLDRRPRMRFLSVNSSDIGAFLKSSLLAVEDPHFRFLWNSYESSATGRANEPSWLVVGSLPEGLAAIRHGPRDQSFIHETGALSRHLSSANEDCQFVRLTLPRYGVGYGLGARKEFPFLTDFNIAITSLKMDGTLRELRNKWWQTSRCLDDPEPAWQLSPGLSIGQMSGIFVMLSVGMTLSLIVSAVEFCQHPNRSKENKTKTNKRNENHSTKSCQSESASALDVYPLEVLPYTETTNPLINENPKTGSTSSQSRETNF